MSYESKCNRLLRTAPARASGENQPQDSMILPEDVVINIEVAEYLEGYKLRLRFSDGQERIVDFGPFLQNSLNPMIRKYLDLERFKKFSLEYGDLFWEDYDLCFPIADLYEGRI